jgi:uncharacterized protein
MRIHFNEIPEEGLRLQVAEDSWFPDQEVVRCGDLRADFFLQRKEQRVFLEGWLETAVRSSCDRCLESFCLPLVSHFTIDVELVDNLPTSDEHVCGSEEMDTLFVDKPEIDIYQVLTQQVFLSLAIKRLCDEECKGLCSGCGVNLNKERCKCSGKLDHSPFGVLDTLRS